MGIEIIETQTISKPYVILDRTLWYTADHAGVVEDGDTRAAFLLGTKGKRVDREEALRVGLVDQKGKELPTLPEETPEHLQEQDEVFYEDMTVDALKDELKDRDLAVSGNKEELIARLKEDDEKQPDDDEDDNDEEDDE